jgi:hypothetical protein
MRCKTITAWKKGSKNASDNEAGTTHIKIYGRG